MKQELCRNGELQRYLWKVRNRGLGVKILLTVLFSLLCLIFAKIILTPRDARSLFQGVVVYGFGVAFVFVIPACIFNSISRDLDDNRWNQIATSSLTPWQLIVGRMIGVPIWTLIVSSLLGFVSLVGYSVGVFNEFSVVWLTVFFLSGLTVQLASTSLGLRLVRSPGLASLFPPSVF